jgi:hypothetical protein
MRLMQRLAGLRVLSLLCIALLTCLRADGQTPGSPVEQIMQGLTPEQIGSITQQLGGGLGGLQGAQGAITSRGTPAGEEQQNLMLQQQRRSSRATTRSS